MNKTKKKKKEPRWLDDLGRGTPAVTLQECQRDYQIASTHYTSN
jgi:hypothetical protein